MQYFIRGVDPCQDHEDANFHCADYDKYHLCTADAGLEYELGHKRCQKHCGFCTSGQALTSNYKPRQVKTNKVARALRKDSDQPGHPPV